MDSPSVKPFVAASQFFVAAVAAVPASRYTDQWSDEWRVLDLIGHGNRANVLPVEYFDRPVGIADSDYVLPANIAKRGRRAVEDLGSDPAAGVRGASERVIAMVEAAPDDATVGTPFGIQTLDAYLRSRTAELVLHGLDLETEVEPPAAALRQCGSFLIEVAMNAGRGLEVVLSLTGRGALPPGFNVY